MVNLHLLKHLSEQPLDISGDIDVDGTSNLDVVDIDGAVDMASTLQVDGAITSSAGATITTADNNPQMTLVSTDADANVGPVLKLYRNSGSPADDDILGRIQWSAEDDAGNDATFARINVVATDVSNDSEDARMEFAPAVADDFTPTMSLTGGNVGIGTTSPARSPLHLATSGSDYCQLHMTNGTSGSASGDGLTLFTNSADAGLMQRENSYLLFGTNDTEAMRITADGTLVISDTTAISGTTFDARDVDNVTSFAVGNNAAYVTRGQDTTAGANLIVQSNRGTLTSPTDTNNGDTLGRIFFRGYPH